MALYHEHVMRGRRIALLFACMTALTLHAESGYDAWLRYPALPASVAEAGGSVTLLGSSEVLLAARAEFFRGVGKMIDRTPGRVVIGQLRDVAQAMPWAHFDTNIPGDGFRIKTVVQGSAHYTVVAGGTDRGVLYGVFALLRKIALERPIDSLDETEVPYAPIRWVNHWDNLDGSIERGYGGRSIFWEKRRARQDLSRVARLRPLAGVDRH